MERTLKVWGLGVRVLHWFLAVAIAAAWITSSGSLLSHQVAGYAVTSVLLARVLWGTACGPRAARWSRFLRFSRQAPRYVKRLFAGEARRWVGHNPLGSAMAFVLLACIACVAFTGWLFTTDRFWGYAWLANLHYFLAVAVLSLVALHVAGVLFTSRHQRENLVASMFTGIKLRRIRRSPPAPVIPR